MLSLSRPAARPFCASPLLRIRHFSSSSPNAIVPLSYTLHEPPTKDSTKPPIIFLHGLFGSKKNNRSMSKVFARSLNRPVYALDLRNHGDSPHDPRHDYIALAEDVEAFLSEHGLRSPTLIGHSMGAKTVMAMALRNPSNVANLVAVDNAPVDAALKSDFGGYVTGMRKVEERKCKRQSEADEVLQEYAPDLPVRQFLLTNLVRSPDNSHLVWRIPISYLSKALDNLGDFPFKNPDETRFEKPALFVRGTKSHYVADETLPIIGRFFPRFEVKDIDSGHWVISEKPDEFRIAVEEFLQDKD